VNKFECDKGKARKNHVKHGIRFTAAARALNSALSLTGRSPIRTDHREERNLSITKLADGRTIVIVWTPRQGNVRLISVRHARQKERAALNAYLQRLQ
jgi:uncharacterized DUF497 family protein